MDAAFDDNGLTESAARSAERQQISRELHNSTSQLLVALQLRVGHLKRAGVADAELLLEEMDQVIREIHHSIRKIGSRQRGGDEDADGDQVAVARLFFALGKRSAS